MSHRVSAFGPTVYSPTAPFEIAFRDRLAELADGDVRDGTPRRPVITAMSTALRCAVEPDQVLRIARGLDAASLWHAYRHVDDLRATAHAALDDFLSDPTPARLVAEGDAIRSLLPGPFVRLESIADRRPDRLAAAACDLGAEIRQFDRSVEEIESSLHAVGSPALVDSLDDGCQGGIFHEAAFRPTRVGAVMPERLAVLLGESLLEAAR